MTCNSCLKERVFLSEAGLCLPCLHFKKHRKDVEEFIEKSKKNAPVKEKLPEEIPLISLDDF